MVEKKEHGAKHEGKHEAKPADAHEAPASH
jgi:hypothetical protein